MAYRGEDLFVVNENLDELRDEMAGTERGT
jgi:hypothetical protein